MTLIICDWSNTAPGTATPGGVALGEPIAERESVEGRRMAFAHPFTPDDIGWLVSTLPGAQAVDVLPGDWRYPEEPE